MSASALSAICSRRMNAAIVTARAGSKSIPDKNVLPVGGRPLVSYPIRAALEAERIAEVYVSTDGERIAAAARELGCVVIERPPELCGDRVNHGEVIRHAVRWVDQRMPELENVVVLLGNTVMVDGALIDRCLGLLDERPELDSVMTVWEAADDHPLRALEIRDGVLRPYGDPERHVSTERQSYPKAYYYDQGVWAFRKECVERRDGPSPWWWMGRRCRPLVRTWVTGRDIHTDFDVADGRMLARARAGDARAVSAATFDATAAPAAVAFDFDGVIVESGAIKQQAFLDLFADRPELHPAILAYHREHLGISRFEKFEWIFRELLGRPLTRADSESLGRRYSELVVAKVMECPLVPGAADLLPGLSRRLATFVVSATPQAELESIVERRGLSGWFREVHGTPGDKAEILRDLMRRYSLKPAALLLVGDGLSDYRAADAAGVPFLLRHTPEQAELFHGLQVTEIRDLTELARLLDRWTSAAAVPARPGREAGR